MRTVLSWLESHHPQAVLHRKNALKRAFILRDRLLHKEALMASAALCQRTTEVQSLIRRYPLIGYGQTVQTSGVSSLLNRFPPKAPSLKRPGLNGSLAAPKAIRNALLSQPRAAGDT